MNKKMISFIGGGNMATAIISGILSSGLSDSDHICATAAHESSVIRLKETLHIEATTDNKAAAQKADILFLAIKPNMFHKVIPEIRHAVKENAIIVSIAAGQTIEHIEEMFETSIKLVRAMPNTPAMVGAAMSAICCNDAVTDEDLAEIQAIFNSFGKSEVVSESMIDTVIGVSGSSPHMYTCLLKQWPMPLWQMACRVRRHINLLPRPYLVPPRWYLRQESIRAN